jgi:hypothetical protein
MNETRAIRECEEATMGKISATACSFVYLTPSKLMAHGSIKAAETTSQTFCATSAATMNISCNRETLVGDS